MVEREFWQGRLRAAWRQRSVVWLLGVRRVGKTLLSQSGTSEIVHAPRVYGFDTGFVCYHRGIGELRREDLGLLFEHYVLNEIHAGLGRVEVQYWRSKSGNEVDFVFAPRSSKAPTAIECKWSSSTRRT